MSKPLLFHLPGPTTTPTPIAEALRPRNVDHRSHEFRARTVRVHSLVRWLFECSNDPFIFPASGTGGWEAALVNTCSPKAHVVACVNGYFSERWANLAERLGLVVQRLEHDWGTAVDADRLARALRADHRRTIVAVLVVHNETSTGVTSSIPRIRAAIDDAGHPALLVVDAVSSLGAIPYHHDRWNVDVTISASQKGLMLPPGLALLAASDRARAAAEASTFPRGYWAWDAMAPAAHDGNFPYTPSIPLIHGLETALELLRQEGKAATAERHRHLAELVRSTATSWSISLVCTDATAASDTVTALWFPGRADGIRAVAARDHRLILASGLGRLAGDTLRMGHLGAHDERGIAAALQALGASIDDVRSTCQSLGTADFHSTQKQAERP